MSLIKWLRRKADPTDYSLKKGDRVTSQYWSHGAVEIIDINWALGAAAVRLNPEGAGGIIIWPVKNLRRKS